MHLQACTGTDLAYRDELIEWFALDPSKPAGRSLDSGGVIVDRGVQLGHGRRPNDARRDGGEEP